MLAEETTRFRTIRLNDIRREPQWRYIPPEGREALEVVGRVLPFRTNPYVLGLIDWTRLPEDPIFQLTFPQRQMLDPDDYETLRGLLSDGRPDAEVAEAVRLVRGRLNPNPAGQRTHNVPHLDGRTLPGLQHKYRETVLFFPAAGQTCHAYCTYCFRWSQFVSLPAERFQARNSADLVAYLERHPDVSDVLFTGGDPLIMGTRGLRRLIEPLLSQRLAHVTNLRIGTKAFAYWPDRFLTDSDADDLLHLFEEIVQAGRHLALMAHYSHPIELSTPQAERAVRRVRASGAEIRMQAPLVRHVNDRADLWAELWRSSVRLGMIPYYMFVERDTGARHHFEVPLVECHRIFREAYSKVSGLARTVRGPVMSTLAGKVRILGTLDTGTERHLLLDYLQARNPDWVRRPFLARYDDGATWFDQLEPATEADRSFFTTPAANGH